MKLFTKIKEIKTWLRQQQREGKSIGFVPTMGFLHEGHLSLIKSSVSENDITVVSIFVNPTQFGPNEDFERYPKDTERDRMLIERAGGQVVFYPDVSEMYPEGYKTYVNVEDLTNGLCGASRPGHFRGVTTVVAKLFNIIHAEKAYFGQKDAQQALVIKQMAKDLNIDTEVKICPIVRENDGLAMSSRNVYLNENERKQAVILSQSLKMAEDLINKGEKNTETIKTAIKNMLLTQPLAEIDYIEIVNGSSLKNVTEINESVLIALAVRFGDTRLIDNLIIGG